MATKRSRSVDERHPRAKYLFQAADLGPEQTLVLSYPTPQDAQRASWALRAFRDRGKLSAPDTYERSKVDPLGEGVGHFDHIVIALAGNTVRLTREQEAPQEPESVEIENG
jgi:hypothetical protein